MTNNHHKEDLLSDTKDMLKEIDDLPLHPKNNRLIYQRYVLSKLTWNLIIADLDITRVKQSLDSIVNQYVRSWLEILIAGTLDIIQLSKMKFGICYVMVSTRLTQCQSVIRNNLQKSSMANLKFIMIQTVTLTYNTINSNIPKKYTQYRKKKEDRITNVLTTQSLVIKSIWEHGMESAAEI